MPFKFIDLKLPGLKLVEPLVFKDERGFFMETFKFSEFSRAGIEVVWVQDNHSMSKKGVLRGLHYQLEPMAQGKLVRVVKGAVFDVAVDIRKGSPTFAKWYGVVLSEQNNYMLWIPPGFAHGFVALEDETHLIYKVSGAEYFPSHERTIKWNDPDIGIDWPIKDPVLSEKDRMAPFLKDAEINFVWSDR